MPPTGRGTVFKITASGTLTTLYNFCAQSACADGAYPEAGLVQAANGKFYGTTYAGGPNGYGTVFKITPGGTLTTHTISAPKADARTAFPRRASSRPPMGTFTG